MSEVEVDVTDSQKRSLWTLVGVTAISVGIGHILGSGYGWIAFGVTVILLAFAGGSGEEEEESREEQRWGIPGRWDEESRTCVSCGRHAWEEHTDSCPEAGIVYPLGESRGGEKGAPR